jgi:hypothetical protein
LNLRLQSKLRHQPEQSVGFVEKSAKPASAELYTRSRVADLNPFLQDFAP